MISDLACVLPFALHDAVCAGSVRDVCCCLTQYFQKCKCASILVQFKVQTQQSGVTVTNMYIKLYAAKADQIGTGSRQIMA